MAKKSIGYMVLISLMVLIISSNFAMRTKAHGPSSMTLGFSGGGTILDITVSHDVLDPNVHFIDLVRINVNGSEVLSESFTNQTSLAAAVFHFPITANTGARIDVYVRCVEGGSVSACMIVGEGSCPQSGGPAIPGYFGLWAIIGVSLIVAMTVMYKKIRH